MAQILLKYELNKGVNFVKTMSFLVAYRIMTLEELIKLRKQFKQGEDVVFEIPDEMLPLCSDELNSLNWKHD
ncbi:MAG: hypothetical protein KDA84_20960 [Planctomycetaceae bacterium]|nr:hypothetical protein [Planctomycetaceae bacterium]